MNPIKKRFFQNLEWPRLKYYLLVTGIAAFTVSLFEYSPGIRFWTVEFPGNIVISTSIALSIFLLTTLFDLFTVRGKVKTFFRVTGILGLGGAMGGLISWQINTLVFDFHISHPFLFLFLTTALALLFSLFVFGNIVMQEHIIKLASQLAKKDISEQRLIQLTTRAELEAIKAKLNPHFLFNALNSIASLIPTDPKLAELMIEKLSTLLRYVMDKSNTDFVALREELEITGDYLEIEKIRLGPRLQYNIEVTDRIKEVLIPGMLLQPLVENSIKHGIAPFEKGGRISITCRLVDDKCEIAVEDTGPGFNRSTNGEGFGLKSVSGRLKLLYGDNFDFKIATRKGTKINIRFPVKRKPGKDKNDL